MVCTDLLIDEARESDEDFILGLVSRFTDFPLPEWRSREQCNEGIRRDFVEHLRQRPADSFMFIARDRDGGKPAGFLHLKKTHDFFNGQSSCHISDLAVPPAHEGRGIAHALMQHAERWAVQHNCRVLSLSVFPGNERARRLYAKTGFDVDLLRMAKPLP